MKILLCLAAVGCACALWAWPAAIPGTVPIGPVFTDSDLVCAARVQTASPAATSFALAPAGREDTASIRLEDVYKGSEPQPQMVKVRYAPANFGAQNGTPVLTPGETVLLFLRMISPGVYTFTEKDISTTQFSRISPLSGVPSGPSKLELALVQIVETGNHNDRINAMQLLEGFDQPSPETLSAVAPLYSSPDPEEQFLALGILLKTKTPAALNTVRYYLQTYWGAQQPMSIIALGTEISQITNPLALLDLEALSGSRFVSVQYGAMQAIRSMRSSKSASFLIRKLDDSNPIISYEALITLNDIFNKNGNYGPSIPLFNKNPQNYIQLWKQWWKDEGRARFGDSSS